VCKELWQTRFTHGASGSSVVIGHTMKSQLARRAVKQGVHGAGVAITRLAN
jgi:hypothetical protein